MTGVCDAQVKDPAPFGPVPTENQVNWQEMEYYAFIHFGLNTYTDQSWEESGMTGIIITAKHHSGFCLWPSKHTGYSVKNAPLKNGKGDIVRDGPFPTSDSTTRR